MAKGVPLSFTEVSNQKSPRSSPFYVKAILVRSVLTQTLSQLLVSYQLFVVSWRS